MTRSAVLTSQAQTDLRDAIRHLDTRFARQGLRIAVQEAANLIGGNPAIGACRPALADARYRLWPIGRFRYVLLYTDATDPPRILRMLHTSRDLAPLLSGLREPTLPSE